jgi:hypothetical protein
MKGKKVGRKIRINLRNMDMVQVQKNCKEILNLIDLFLVVALIV